MILKSLHIQNFRACRDVTVAFDPYTCLVGENGAGKSSVLTALNVLFRNSASSATPVATLTEEDFTHRDTSRPVIITATFGDLSPEEQIDFKAYYRQGALVISAKAAWNHQTLSAEVRQFGARLVMRAFTEWFEQDSAGARVPELRTTYGQLRNTYPDLPAASTKADMELALRVFEEGHPDLCELVDSEDQFYGWSKGDNRLRKYLQWVYVPAVKEAGTEQTEGKNTALGQLLQRTIRAKVSFDTTLQALKAVADQGYRAMLDEQQAVLKSLASSLETRLQRWAHPDARLDLEWQFDPEKSVAFNGPVAKAAVGEGEFVGDVSRLGHGLQRLFIVSLLQELAAGEAGVGPKLLLGIEEPELYQHPPQARHLAATLTELSAADTQVLVATHSPFFASGRTFESVRLLRKGASPADETTVRQISIAQISARIADALGEVPVEPSAMVAGIEQIIQPSQRELLFCGVPVLVEGEEDVAFIATWLRLGGHWDAFRRIGGHFIIAGGKTNLSRPMAIGLELELPVFVVFDGDGPHSDASPNAIQKKARNRRDNSCLLKLAGLSNADPLSDSVIRSASLTMWPETLAGWVKEEIGVDEWATASEQVRSEQGLQGVSEKNGVVVAAILENLWESGVRSACLDQLCRDIIALGAMNT